MSRLKSFLGFAKLIILHKTFNTETNPSFSSGGAVVVVEPRTPEREVGVRSSVRAPCCVLEQKHIYLKFPKVLVIPRNRWLHPDIYEKLFTVT